MMATWPWARLLLLDLINGSFKVRGKFRALCASASRARHPKHPKHCFPRNPRILLHSTKESSRKKLLNAMIKSICRFVLVGKRAKIIADLHRSYVLKRATANASQGKVAGIPSLAALSPFGASGGIQALCPSSASFAATT